MATAKIVDREGYEYVMYARRYGRYDVTGTLLCFDADDRRLTGTSPMLFNALMIDTRFCVLVDDSVYCEPHYVNNILTYIGDNREQVGEVLREYLSDAEIDRFLEQISPLIYHSPINTGTQFCFNGGDDVPSLALGTARKRFFVLSENNSYDEIGFPTAAAIYGMENVTEKCRQLNYLNGVGLNGRAIWLDGLGIQDIDRDGYHGGWCR